MWIWIRSFLILIVSSLFFPFLVYANTLEFFNLETIYWEDSEPYNPFDTTTSTYKVTSKIKNNTSSKIDAFVTASKGNNNSLSYTRIAQDGLGNELVYQLYSQKNADDNAVLKEFSDLQSETETISVSDIKAGEKKNGTFFITVPAGQNVPGGSYSDSIQFVLYEGEWDDSEGVQESVVIDIYFQVANVLSLNFGVNDSSDLDIDFGLVEENMSKQLYVRVVSNTRFDLIAQSQESQKLVHEGGNANMSLSYIFKYNNTQVDLSSGLPVTILDNESKRTSGKDYPFSLQLPASIPLLSAGQYRDTIYMSVVAQ